MAENEKLENIIAQCKAGSPDGFTELVNLYSNRLYGYYYRLTGNSTVSDDLLSELFVKLVQKIDSYKGDCFDAWLFRVASNIFNDHLRHKMRQQKLLEQKGLSDGNSLWNENIDEVDNFDELQRLLSQLDGDTKELIVMRYYSQMSFKELAKTRNEPVGTTLSRLHRGLKRLKEQMVKK